MSNLCSRMENDNSPFVNNPAVVYAVFTSSYNLPNPKAPGGVMTQVPPVTKLDAASQLLQCSDNSIGVVITRSTWGVGIRPSKSKKMVTKKIRTEYMKKFKDPKWETYSKCYEDSLKYRLTRRLLEQAHKPWFWQGWDSGSESSGRSTPRNRNKVEPLNLPVLKSPTPHENETCEPLEQKSVLKDSSEPNGTCLEIAEPPAETDISHPLLHTDAIVEGDSTEEDQRHGEEKEHTGRPRGARSEPDCSGHAPSNSHLRRKPARAKSQPPREPVEKQTEKENRHPFVLYGWAEKQAETAVKKTHNVCSSASAKEIYPSALRAKTRREAEKRGRALDRRRARSADLEKMHKAKLDPVDDPWMTEYMRCFSARSR